MMFVYLFFISFLIVFFSELGDKTQLLVLSFSANNRAKNILIGVAIGSFLSHGIAIFFGSRIGGFANDSVQFYLKLFACLTFLLLGIIGFLPNKGEESDTKKGFMYKLSNLKINYIFIVALSIVIGEFGDKTFLSSLSLGLQYPDQRLPLVLGAVLGMVLSNSIAIFFGKFLKKRFKENIIHLISNTIFLLFGALGMIGLLLF